MAERPTRARYCSTRCRVAAHRARKLRPIVPADEPVEPIDRTVTDLDLAATVLQIYGALRALRAGSKYGPPTLRPMCGRLAGSIARALEREGL